MGIIGVLTLIGKETYETTSAKVRRFLDHYPTIYAKAQKLAGLGKKKVDLGGRVGKNGKNRRSNERFLLLF